MGNDQNKKNTDVEIELNHTKITSIKVINDSKKRYMQAAFGILQQDYNAWSEQLSNSKANSDYLLIPFKHNFSSKELCGNAGFVTVDYQNYPYLLIEQIDNRRAKKKRFEETELWQLLYCLVDAQRQLKNGANLKVGDIRPHNIFLNQQGSIKVANLLSWPKEATNYQKFLQNQITYMAPEDMHFLETSSINNDANTLSEVFSIGLTVLSAANLADYRSLYNTKTYQFNLTEFNQIVREWCLNDVYSDIFKATICSLLAVEVQHRLSQQQLQPWITKYRADILSRHDFVITDPPKKIISQVQLIRKAYENSGHKHIGAPLSQAHITSGAPYVLQGSRRVVNQYILPPVSSIPGSMPTESIYTPIDKSIYNSSYVPQVSTTINPNPIETFLQKPWLIQGAPMQSTGPVSYVPRTKFEYNSSPNKFDSDLEVVYKNVADLQEEKTSAHQIQHHGENNQPQINEQHEHYRQNHQ